VRERERILSPTLLPHRFLNLRPTKQILRGTNTRQARTSLSILSLKRAKPSASNTTHASVTRPEYRHRLLVTMPVLARTPSKRFRDPSFAAVLQQLLVLLVVLAVVVMVLVPDDSNAAEASSLVRTTRHSRFGNHGGRKPRTRTPGNDTNPSPLGVAEEVLPEQADGAAADAATTEGPPLPKESVGIYVDKPVLRGQFHKWGAILYPPLMGLPLALRAAASKASVPDGSRSLLRASLRFSFAVESIFVVSGTLHRYPWKNARAYHICRKLDYAAIFFGIANFYSSLGWLLCGHHELFSGVIEPIVWTGACAGTFLKWFFPTAPPVFNSAVFLVHGWAILPLLPLVLRSATPAVAGSFFAGAISVSLGTLAYALQWPRNARNKPQREIVFGPHEMFHLGTVLMVAGFWFAVWTRISSPP